MKKFLPICFLMFACNNIQRQAEVVEKKSDSLTVKQTQVENTVEWIYEEREDKMTSKMMYQATLEASHPLELKFPYEGSVAAIGLLYKNNKNAVILAVSKGQFMAGADDQSIKVRFDTAKVETYLCSASSDGNSERLFINSSTKFLNKLKSSSKVVIEVEMYQNGLKQMEFNCHGLTWNH